MIECLEDPDMTLKSKTLDLLVRMTNKKNVEAIVEKLMENLKQIPSDSKVKKELVANIHNLVDKYSPNKTWFVRTMNKLFIAGGDLVTSDISNKFIKVVSKKVDKTQFKDSTVKIYKNLLKKNQTISDSHMKTIVWILGEYLSSGEPSPNFEKEHEILNLLCQSVLERTFEEETTWSWIVIAVTKIHTHMNFSPNAEV